MNSRWVKSEAILDSNNNNNKNHNRDNDSNSQTASPPKPGGPLKPRLDAVQKKIQVQIARLDQLHTMLMLKDREALDKLTVSIKDNNAQHSTVLSSELASSRQISRVVLLSYYALQKLTSNLSTASGFGDLVVILAPAMAVVKNLRSSLTPYMPEMEVELGMVSELLSGILVDAAQVGSYIINFESANEEAVHIIEEAAITAEQKIREEYLPIPELPMMSIKFIQTGSGSVAG
jgi:division protein CdvB (Snf7/Vps24/ESCRT-III family)